MRCLSLARSWLPAPQCPGRSGGQSPSNGGMAETGSPRRAFSEQTVETAQRHYALHGCGAMAEPSANPCRCAAIPTAALSAAVYVVSGAQRRWSAPQTLPAHACPCSVSCPSKGITPVHCGPRFAGRARHPAAVHPVRPHLAAGCRCLEGMAQGTRRAGRWKTASCHAPAPADLPACAAANPAARPQRTSAQPASTGTLIATVTVTGISQLALLAPQGCPPDPRAAHCRWHRWHGWPAHGCLRQSWTGNTDWRQAKRPRSGPTNRACCQVLPPSMDTSTPHGTGSAKTTPWIWVHPARKAPCSGAGAVDRGLDAHFPHRRLAGVCLGARSAGPVTVGHDARAGLLAGPGGTRLT